MTKRLNIVGSEFVFETIKMLTLESEFILHKNNNYVFLTHVESATATETKLFGNSCTVKRNSQIIQSNYLI